MHKYLKAIFENWQIFENKMKMRSGGFKLIIILNGSTIIKFKSICIKYYSKKFINILESQLNLSKMRKIVL